MTDIRFTGIDMAPGGAEAAGERCRNSLHAHGLPRSARRRGLLDWEADRFQQAVGQLGLGPWLTCALHCAVRSVEVELPLERDDGTLEVYTGYRVQHSHALGPAKGGVRYHPSVGAGEVTALARLMRWKAALAGLPFGGGKGGIPCDPARFSSRELRRLTHLYTAGILPVIGPDTDVLAPTALGIYDDSGQLAAFVHHGIDEDTVKAIGDHPQGRGLFGEVVVATDPSASPTRRGSVLVRLSAQPPSDGQLPRRPHTPRRAPYGTLYLAGKAHGAPLTRRTSRRSSPLPPAAGAIETTALWHRSPGVCAMTPMTDVRRLDGEPLDPVRAGT